MTRRTTALVGLALVVLAGGVYLGVGQGPDEVLTSFLYGDPDRGGRVFYDKGCAFCHTVSGEGGGRANDLSRISDDHMSLNELVGVMWNHGPDMWELIEKTGAEFPRIKEREMADLFAYLYLIRYLDEPGDIERGERLMSEKGCVACHALAPGHSGVGPDLADWGAVENPLLWVQEMWNHGTAMEAAMVEKGMVWPQFEGEEMVDLLSYVREAMHAPGTVTNLLPANPGAGKKLFRDKGCVHCHAVRGDGGNMGVDLGRAPEFPRTLTQVAGLMWNHSPQMWAEMEAEHVQRPTFTSSEMIDLLAYLFVVRYFDEPGDPEEGRQVYIAKACVECHRLGESGGAVGPDINRWRGRISPIAMAYVMWRHGPKMYESMQEKGLPWPTFENREMAHLLAFVNGEE